ncbi:MAG: phasin family protein [Kiloniellaceae bacterium]
MPNQKSSTKKPASKTTAAKKASPASGSAVSIEPVAAAMTANQESIETVMKAGTQAATKGYEQTIALAQEQVEKASETIFQRYDEVASLGKESVDAYVLSSNLFAKGVESMGKELMSMAQSAVEANVATTKAVFGATSVRELIDLQTEFSRSRFDSLVADSAKLTELSMALASDTIEPIQLSMNTTVEKLLKPIAA